MPKITSIPLFLKKLLFLYLVGLITFFCYRMIFLYRIDAQLLSEDTFRVIIAGFQFDSVIMAYVLAFPAAYHLLISWLELRSAIHRKIIFYYLFVSSVYVILIALTDLAYYEYFDTRLNLAIFNLLSVPSIAARILISEYWAYVFAFLIFSFVAWRSNILVAKRYDRAEYLFRALPLKRSITMPNG